MADGYSRSPKLLKGALVQFSAPMLVPIPNVIVFQYNPESLSRSLKGYDPPSPDKHPSTPAEAGTDLTQPFDPQETFTLSVTVDATDALENPIWHPVALLTGVADRLAAMEMLLYPPAEAGDKLLSSIAGSLNVSAGIGGVSAGGLAGGAANAAPKPPRRVPVVLFVWGPGRIVPVRVETFTVEEQQFNQLLYPHRAKVSLGLKVITDESQAFKDESQYPEVALARAAYKFTRKQKQVLAVANVANTVESVLGLLPF
jgi:hypothetical protein